MDVWHAFHPCLVSGGLGKPARREQYVPPALHGIHDTGRRTFTLNTESTYDWREENWSVPLNFMLAKLTKIGGQPVQFQVGRVIRQRARQRSARLGRAIQRHLFVSEMID